MSDHRAVAAATVTLQNVLIDAVREAVPGASVSTGPPPARSEHEHSEGLINVFLYKVEPNATWRNEELPFRRSDGTLSHRPQLAIDLFYLLSFYGDDSRQIPNQLLGAALAALHAEPYPRAHHIPQEPADGMASLDGDDGGVDLAGSGLLNQRHPLSFTLLSNAEDEVIQTWTRLLQTSYVLSMAYIGRVLMIEPEVVPEPSLPARRTALYFHGGGQPRLEAVTPPSLGFTPRAEVRLRGTNLQAEEVRVAFGELEAQPIGGTDDELRVLLPEGIQAGTSLVRVLHGEDHDRQTRWQLASNPLAVVVRPSVTGVSCRPAADLRVVADDERDQVTLEVGFAPAVRATTSVELWLNRSPSPEESISRAGYAFHCTADPQSPDHLSVTASVAPGRYLVRVRIAGVDSRLVVDEDPASPTFERYVGPLVEIA